MPKRFIIVTDSKRVTAEHRNAITSYVKKAGWNYWHWFSDTWFVRLPEETDAADLYRRIDGLFPAGDKPRILIVNGEGESRLSGRAQKKALPWLRNKWGTQ